MRKLMKTFAVLTATLLAFASCQQEIDPVESGVSHTLRFVAGAPETKTSFKVEGADVNYSWSETDATDHSTGDTKRPEKFQVFENGVAATSINAELTGGEMWIEATFEGQRPQQAEYRALFNAGVKSEQSSMDESYDQDSDVLVSNVLKNVDLEAEHLVFSFRREVAFGAVTLKGLDEGDYLLNVKIESDKPLAGDYDLVNESWKNTSTTLSIDSFNDIDGGEATLYFLTLPVESATLKMTVQTTDDLDNVKATYVKEFKKTISFSQGDVRPFNVTLEKKAASVHDIFTSSDFPATSTTYENFTGVRKNTAVYAGNTSLNNGISLRSSNSNSGIVSTTSGGKIKSVSVKWNSSTASGRTIDVYGNNTAYAAASELYNANSQGTKIGSIVIGTSTSLSVTGDYAYVGIRSNSGALYLEEIDFEWADGGTPPATNYTITVADGIVGGTVTASAAEAVAGTEITLTATPADKYVFDSWNVTNASTSEAITVTDNKFTMPAANVNVSAIFKEQGGSGDETSFIFNTDAGLTALGITKPSSSQGTNLGTSAYVSDAIEMTATDGGTATRVWNSGGNTTLRVYNNGGSLTFSGATITKIAFAGTVPMNANVGTFNSTTKEWTGSASSVTFTATAGVTISTITVTYTGVGPAKYLVDCATVTGGTLSATPTKAPEGTIVELTATPAAEYTFNNDWTVKGADETPITVTDGKFTMPAQNVTVSGSFTQKTYAITKMPATNGTYTVKVSDVEVETAVKGAKVTLAAEPAELYKFDGFTVKETVSGNVVTVSNNTFTMPGAAVTVSAAFSEKPVGPTYEGSGTEEDPYTINDAYMLIDGLGTETSEEVCVKGTIYQVDSYNASYKSITYWIGSSEKPLEVYGGLNLKDAPAFTSKDDLNIGDEVVVKGNLKNYNGTYEFTSNNYLVSIKKAPYLKATSSKTTGIAAAGETVTVTVDTNIEGWTANSDNAAFTISGKTATSFNVVVSANTTTSERTAKITVSATGVNPVEITLKQDKSGGKTKDNTAKYTLTPTAGSNNSYTGNCDVAVGIITWNVSGNSQQIPWRLGGKSISNVDRTVYSKTAYSKELWKVSLTVGSASSITVNSLKLVYSTNANFSDSKEIAGTFKANSTIDFEAEFPANCYYKFVFNVSVSGNSNKFVEFSKVEFYGYQGE